METKFGDYFRGKKITLMGLGLLGRGVGDARFLAKYAKELIVTDLKSAKELRGSVAKLKRFKNIKFHLGGHRLADFRNRDLIIRAAGVPLASPFIAEAEKHKISVQMSTALFAKFALEAGAKIIGVTGTRGKSTTTHLIHRILTQQCQGVTLTRKRCYLGGNVMGMSTLALLPKIKSSDLVVLELDSWQLQGFGTLKISPQIAVFTNFLPDHLNYYLPAGRQAAVGIKRYFADKANIFKYQKPGDRLFRGGQVPPPPKRWRIKLPGEHNLNNIALAIAVARELKAPEGVIKKAVENFSGLPGRLELVQSASWRRRGIKIYNDTTATTPTATLAALEALTVRHSMSNKNIVLILGGADKRLDLSALRGGLPKYCKQAVLLPGTGTDKMEMDKEPGVPSTKARNMPEAVKTGFGFCRRGDILLLSPAFASFGPPPGGFKNEYDRGRQFVRLVKKLK